MHFEVDRGDFRHTRLIDPPTTPLGPGQVRLTVERFALTANNVTYALAGDMLDYWGFHPAEAPWGRLPVMGIGVVSESAANDIPVGGRYFGFYSMSSELVIEAAATSRGFRDVGAHRQRHAPAYVGFNDLASDPAFRDDRVDEYLLLRGLFVTSFLIDDFLDDNNSFGAEQILVTSASSKTSISLAHCLAARGQRSIGVTSRGNVDFVEALGLYSSVITYDDIGQLDPAVPTVAVDVAGNTRITEAIHRHFADQLKYSCLVGASHWEDAGERASELPGATPTLFFAPSQGQKRSQEWGDDVFATRVGDALASFLDTAPQWLAVQHSVGPDAVREVYLATVEGQARPDIGHILSLSGGLASGSVASLAQEDAHR